jgi:hypothetical protein
MFFLKKNWLEHCHVIEAGIVVILLIGIQFHQPFSVRWNTVTRILIRKTVVYTIQPSSIYTLKTTKTNEEQDITVIQKDKIKFPGECKKIYQKLAFHKIYFEPFTKYTYVQSVRALKTQYSRCRDQHLPD